MNFENLRTQELMFLRSALAAEGSFKTTDEVIRWISEQNSAVTVNVEKTTFKNLANWSYENSALRHNTGRFFSIDGINVKTNWGDVSQWDQPIINQPEIGYLGIIVKEFNGVLHFLMQAKIEPGNVNSVQLSPTLQATKSNYSQVHKGKKPAYLDYFRNVKPDQVLLDQLQSEQGGRFLKKRNRNIIIKIDTPIEVNENFAWVTLGQLKQLMLIDNLVNMDTRTVVSGISYGDFTSDVMSVFNTVWIERSKNKYASAFFQSALTCENAYHSFDSILTFMTRMKALYELDIVKKDLKCLDLWKFTDTEIVHEDSKYFKIIAVDVSIENREVVNWMQPMVEPTQEGLCAFVVKEINGVFHFAVQAKLESGNFDIVEMAPTVQCLTGNYRETGIGKLPFLDYVLNCSKENIVYDTIQSEEGGRFYKEQNRSMIVVADETFGIDLPENYIWISLNQLYTFIKFNNYLNIQARSLISLISFL